jgi:hypothetical protein
VVEEDTRIKDRKTMQLQWFPQSLPNLPMDEVGVEEEDEGRKPEATITTTRESFVITAEEKDTILMNVHLFRELPPWSREKANRSRRRGIPLLQRTVPHLPRIREPPQRNRRKAKGSGIG